MKFLARTNSRWMQLAAFEWLGNICILAGCMAITLKVLHRANVPWLRPIEVFFCGAVMLVALGALQGRYKNVLKGAIFFSFYGVAVAAIVYLVAFHSLPAVMAIAAVAVAVGLLDRLRTGKQGGKSQ